MSAGAAVVDPMSLADKVIVITGAGSGIGRLAASTFAEQGATVVAVDLPPRRGEDDPLEETVRSAPSGRVTALHADITHADVMRDVGETATSLFGRIDGVLACAAVLRGGGVIDTTDADHALTMRVNIDGTLNTLRATVPGLRAAGGGSIVLMSSLAGLRGNPMYASYVASKHAVVGIMRTAAKELGGDFIRVNTINPTIVDTPMMRGDRDGRVEPSFDERTATLRYRHALPISHVEPIDVVHAARFLLSDASRYVTGSLLLVDAGASA